MATNAHSAADTDARTITVTLTQKAAREAAYGLYIVGLTLEERGASAADRAGINEAERVILKAWEAAQ